MLRYVKTICISPKNVLSLYQRRGESPQTKGFLLFFHTKMAQKTIVLQSIQKNLYAEADFLSAFADFFRAKLVRELTIQRLKKLKDIYFQPCIFFILGNYTGRFLQARGAIRSAPEGATCGKTIAAKKSTPGLSYIKAHIQIVIICNSSFSISGYQYVQMISADLYGIWLCSTSDQIFL